MVMKIILRSLFFLTGYVLFLSLLIIPSSGAKGQIIESWDVFSALDRSTNLTVDSEDRVWVGTTGGGYSYNPADGSVTVYRTSEGLLRLNASAVGVDPSSGDIYFGGGGGTISTLRKEGGWTYTTDIARSSQTQKGIRDFLFANDLVYILTDFGVAVFDPFDSTIRDSWSRLGALPSSSPVNDIAFFNDSVWLATPYGLAAAQATGRNLADPLNWKIYTKETLCGDSVVFSVKAVDGKLMVGTGTGVCEYDGGSFKKRGDIGGRVLLEVNGGAVVAANEFRLYSYSSTSGFSDIGGTPRPIVALASFSDGRPVAAMDQGGIAFPLSGEIVTFAPNGPSSNQFADLTMGSNHDLWVVSNILGLGLSRLSVDDEEWINFTPSTDPRITRDAFWQINADDFGRIWASSFGDGIYVFNPASASEEEITLQQYDENNSLLEGIADDPTYVLGGDALPDGSGVTWILNYDPTPGQRGGVLLANTYDPASGENQFYLFSASSTFPNLNLARSFAYLEIDFNGGLWLGSDRSEGILVFSPGESLDQPGEWKRLTTANGLISNTIKTLLIDPDGELWIGTPNGAHVLVNPGTVAEEGGEAAIFRELRPVKETVVRDIIVDPLNRKWVATDKGVLVLSSDGTELLTSFTESNSPLTSNDVLSLYSDDSRGQIYIGTSQGLNRVQTEAIASGDEPERIYVTPQPFFPGTDPTLRATGLPQNSSVKILKLDGSLVTEFSAPGGDIAFWSGKDAEGEYVASGVYLIIARSPLGETAVGKIAVVRQ